MTNAILRKITKVKHIITNLFYGLSGLLKVKLGRKVIITSKQ